MHRVRVSTLVLLCSPLPVLVPFLALEDNPHFDTAWSISPSEHPAMMSSRGNRRLRLHAGGLLKLTARDQIGGGFVALGVVVLRVVLVVRQSLLGLAGL